MVLSASSVLSEPHLLLRLAFADLGHYNLFKGGVLHRDISSGNIIRYPKPVERPALDE